MQSSFKILMKRRKLYRRARVRAIKRTGKKPFVFIPVVTLFGLTALTVAIFGVVSLAGGKSALNPTDSKIVIITYDKKKQTIPTTARTVGVLLKKLDIRLGKGDVVEPSIETKIVEDNFHVNVYRALPVMIIDGDKKVSAVSAATTPRSIARQVGVVTYPEDNLQTEPIDNFLVDGAVGQKVIIDRATPVNMNLYGAQVTLRTHAKTVDELLKERNIKLGKNDAVLPERSTALADNAQVFVNRKGVKIETVEEVIAMTVETIDDASLSFGTTAVRQQGSNGKRLVTYEIETKNGQEVSRKPIQSVIAVQPVTQIVARGKAVQIPSDISSVMAQAGIASGDYGYVNYIISRESGWCPTKMQGQIGYCPGYAPEVVPSGLGYGLGQATPGTKMAGFGADWKTNPVTQLRWATSYAVGRYGSWEAAYNYWYSHHHW